MEENCEKQEKQHKGYRELMTSAALFVWMKIRAAVTGVAPSTAALL